MWICHNRAFLSVVANREDKNTLLVRARIEGNIEAVFPDAKIFYRINGGSYNQYVGPLDL